MLYRERHPDGPFVTLIAVAATYSGPDACDGAYRDLISRARTPGPGDEQIRAFTTELSRALADPGELPGGELSGAVGYSDGSDQAFLRRLWHDLYGDQPCPGDRPDPAPAEHPDPDTPGAAASHHRALDAAYYEDLAGRLYGLLIGLDDRIGREQARLLHHFIEVGEYDLALEEIAGTLAQDTIAITGQERGDMLALAARMKLEGGLVARALAACPATGGPEHRSDMAPGPG
jgi:hypothetical protein